MITCSAHESANRVCRLSSLAGVVGSLVLAASIPRVSSAQAEQDQLQEITVTAEKRSETVQNIPISITAMTGQQLAAQGIATVEDMAATTPGISMRTAGPGQTEFEMRGLASSGGAAPTVGFYLDETPLTPSASSFNGRDVIDPDLFDLSRVEVLRGPQGTLYGSGSMGGTIRLITNAPKLQTYEGAVNVGLSNTQGGGLNPGGSAMVNLPLGDVVALRLVGTEKYTDGYIDRVIESPFPLPTSPCAAWYGYGCTRGNVAAGPITQTVKNTNTEQLTAGRASLLVQPSDTLSSTTTIMYQRILAGGYSEYEDPPGANVCLCIYQPYNLKEPISDTFRLASETITYQLGFASLTSATGYWAREQSQSQDQTEALQNVFLLPAFLPVYWTEDDKSSQLSEELRLTSTSEGPLQWVGGAFFENLHAPYLATNQSPAYAPLSYGGASANPNGVILDIGNHVELKQYALFTDVSYQFTSTLKLITGLRWFKYDTRSTYWENGAGSPTGNASVLAGSQAASDSGFNPKVTLDYAPNSDLTVYSTIAKGFRPGGTTLPVPTSGAVICPNVPLTYGPDSVWNFEVGEKAKLLGDRLVLNTDVYYIHWSGIQQNITLPCGYTYTANAGVAQSYGPEIELTARLTPELSTNLTATTTNATITHANAGTGILDGTRVLNIPKETASLGLTYDRRAWDGFDWVSRLTDSYVGNAADIAFFPTVLPPHNLIDFRSGLVNDRWSVYLFGTNLTNRHAALTTNNTSIAWTTPSITRVTTNQPRTLGVNLLWKF